MATQIDVAIHQHYILNICPVYLTGGISGMVGAICLCKNRSESVRTEVKTTIEWFYLSYIIQRFWYLDIPVIRVP
jgi:hypothetical protein